MACEHNLAFNRQTRMLANLSKVHCYNTSGTSPAQRDRLLLQSAKENLLQLAFFGLVELQTYTQFLFQHTLNLTFLRDFVQHNATHSSKHRVSAEETRRMAELNHLDIELYQFAKDLFLQRVRQAYLDEGLPVPPQVEQLRSLQAGQAPPAEETNEGGLVAAASPTETPPPSESQPSGPPRRRGEDEKDAAAQRFAHHIFQTTGSNQPGLPAGWVDDNFLGSETEDRPSSEDEFDAERGARLRSAHRLPKLTPSSFQSGGDSDSQPQEPQQRSSGFR